jgi:hypothetical protein
MELTDPCELPEGIVERHSQNGTKADKSCRIRVKGVANYSMTDWLGDIQVLPQENGETLLIGQFADQPALRGLMDQLWNLNFTLLSVERIESQAEQDNPGVIAEGEKP